MFSYAFHSSSSFGWPVLEALVDFMQPQQRLRGPVRGLGLGWMVDGHKPGVLVGEWKSSLPQNQRPAASLEGEWEYCFDML